MCYKTQGKGKLPSAEGLRHGVLTWFDGALLAFVEAPGSTHTSTAVVLFG